MKTQLMKAVKLSLILAVLLIPAYGQNDSDGTFALPNKVVPQGNCSMTDLQNQFINERSSTCAQQQTGFANGEIRWVKSGVGQYVLSASDAQNVFEITSCAGSSNGTWTRTMSAVTTPVSDSIRCLTLKRNLVLFGCYQSHPLNPESCDCGEGYITSSGPEGCDCTPVSPIIIDLDGNGVKLTNKAGGVKFDLDANGQRRQLPWTQGDSRDGWLVLDQYKTGFIEDGQQLFGDQSAQSRALNTDESENGYRALRVFDDNKDGQITTADGVWNLLGVWIDANQNGVSDAGEVLS